jgi:hypothetical protein
VDGKGWELFNSFAIGALLVFIAVGVLWVFSVETLRFSVFMIFNGIMLMKYRETLRRFKESEHKNTRSIVLACVAGGLFFVIFYPWGSFHLEGLSFSLFEGVPYKLDSPVPSVNTYMGLVGDFFGGILGPILSFLTIMLVIQQAGDNSKREEARDRHQGERDLLEMIKIDMDIFLKQVDKLEDRLENLKFMKKTGLDALKMYHTSTFGMSHIQIQDLCTSKAAEEEHFKSFIKAFNRTFDQIFFDIETLAQSTNVSVHARRAVEQRYKILTTHFDPEIFKHCKFIMQDFKDNKVEFNYLMNGCFILAMDQYLEKEDYPDFLNQKEILKIIQVSKFYRNEILNPLTKKVAIETYGTAES